MASSLEERVLVLMPTAIDAERTGTVLTEAGVEPYLCADLTTLCHELTRGAGAVLITDEPLLSGRTGLLAEAIRAQPAWSSVPIVVIVHERAADMIHRSSAQVLRNLTFIERPVRTRSLVSVVLSALASRRHQYQIRDHVIEREQSAAAAAAQEERLRFALRAGGLGSWSFDIETRALESSEDFRSAFGRSGDEPLTLDDVLTTIHPEDRERFIDVLRSSEETGAELDLEIRVARPGRPLWLMIRGQRLGRSLVGVALDITADKRMREELEEAAQRKDEFLATLAHELRNPLAPIRTGIELLGIAPKPEVAERTIGVMNRQVTHMVRLIDDLLDVSRITRGKLVLKRERVSLASAVSAAVEASRPRVDAGKHSLEVSLGDDSAMLDADPTRVTQIVGNLLDNACKYTTPGGHITLTTRREGKHAVISLRDNGIGVAPERAADIFELFSQVKTGLDGTRAGLGIGLALVRRLVELHGGTIELSSPGLGAGSTFTVRLPLAREAEAKSQRRARDITLDGHGKKVLVVDDNIDAAEMLSLMLEQAGFQIITAHDGVGAVAAARAATPDIVVLDIGLPDTTGYDVARELRKLDRTPPLRLIALTGWGTQDDKRKAREAGFDAHLTKPIDADLLYAALAG